LITQQSASAAFSNVPLEIEHFYNKDERALKPPE